MVDAEHTIQSPVLWLAVLGGVNPCLFYVGAIGKCIASGGSVGRTADAGITQMEHTLEVVAIRIPYLAVADGTL